MIFRQIASPLCFAPHGPGYLPLSENAKVASRVILRMDSYDLHGIGFFHENELKPLSYSSSLVVSFSSYGRFFLGVIRNSFS
jgi:hypothetical protein